MPYDEVLQATLLLSCYFNKNEVKNVKPLTPTEYGRFAAWLHQQGLTPASLLHDQKKALANWHDPKNKITHERIESLFSRGASMGFALEHWAKHGVWIVSRASKVYPQKIREKIGDTRPPILFGVGNQSLLNKRGIGFVGSRSIDEEDETFAKSKAELAVSQGYVVVSGGAKGIDQTSMIAALASGGESVGILADSLLRASASKVYRKGLRQNKLALISPFYPEAGFNTGNAMARNKYIYAMSELVVVVKSDFEKGGTWAGAQENLKKQWVPLLVRASSHEGNRALVDLGAQQIDELFEDFNQLADKAIQNNELIPATIKEPELTQTDDFFWADVSVNKQAELASKDALQPEPLVQTEQKPLEQTAPEPKPVQPDDLNSNSISIEESGKENNKPTDTVSFFDNYGQIFLLFYHQVVETCQQDKAVTPAQLQEAYPELPDSLIKKWLKQLENEGYLKKEGRKLIFTLTDKTRA